MNHRAGENGEAQKLRRLRLIWFIFSAAALFIYLLWDMPRAETVWRVSDGKRQYPFGYVTEEACGAVAQRANHDTPGDYYWVPGVEYLNGWNHPQGKPMPGSPSPSPRAPGRHKS